LPARSPGVQRDDPLTTTLETTMNARIVIFSAFACFASFPAFAGAIGGPNFTSTQVLANSTDVFHVAFAGGESATVASPAMATPTSTSTSTTRTATWWPRTCRRATPRR
jgi:hypothetical protein